VGFVEWAAKMRKKPIAERRQFVIFWTVVIMSVIAVVWLGLFFAGISKELEENREREEAKSAVPMTFNEEQPTPFPLEF
jgi:hypothetical protein